MCYTIIVEYDAGWSSPVARRAHNPKVGGSNPPPATNNKKTPICDRCFFIIHYAEADIGRLSFGYEVDERGSIRAFCAQSLDFIMHICYNEVNYNNI